MKPRSDSKLKGLPPARQEQIVEWATTPKSETCVGGLAFAREQLAKDGLKVSVRALSEFLSWWRLRERYSSAEERAQQLQELLQGKSEALSPEQIRKLGHALFTMEAVEAGDAKTFVGLEQLRLDQVNSETKASIEERKLQLAERRVKVAERKLESLKGILTDGTLSAEERERRMKQQFGIA